MYFIKNFFSYILAIIFFIAVLTLGTTNAVKELLTHNHLYNALETTDYIDQINIDIDNEISEDILKYVEIKDIIDHYLADKILYEFNVIDTNPKLDINEINNRIAIGLEEYIDDKLDEYSGGLTSLLEQNGIDLGIKDKVEQYIENKTSINFSSNEIITEKDLDSVYKEIDETFIKIKEKTYISEIIDFIYNNKLPIVLWITIITTFILISLINFNILTGILYTIVPFIINTIIYLIGYYSLDNLNFTGSYEASALNYITQKASSISFAYFFFLLLITIIMCFLYYIGKHINILISHKTGKTTLDTIFDDYDSEEVVKQLQQKETKKKNN